MYRCSIIGLSDSREQWLAPDILRVIAEGKVFSGGRRHHDIVARHLPEDASWIDITVPLDKVYEQYRQYDEVVVFASGDPLFYGFAGTLQRIFPDTQMKVYPAFNSLQMLAHRLNMPYQDMHAVSLTGRTWERFDEALIMGERLIGCLTDRTHTPHSIHQRMTDYGYDNYVMYVGENLGNEASERVSIYDSATEYAMPNCIILSRKHSIRRSMGIPDTEFHLLDGRSRMITKMPIRLCTLATLQLADRQSFWDIGFCTGSISIEARLCYPHLSITAFEVREEGRRLMALNSRKFHAPGISTVIGDFCQCDISALPRPDAVFIGGHGGRMKEMLTMVRNVLLPGGVVVFNSVSETSRQAFTDTAQALGMTVTLCHTIVVDNNNPITILKAE